MSVRARLRRWLPHPVLSLALILAWVALQNEFAAAHWLMGAIVGVVIPRLLRPFWPDPPPVRSWRAALAYAAVVLWDIAKANVQVAGWVLLRRPETLRSSWLVVPLELRVPEAITLLAGTITMTPGTVSCDLAADGSALLVHCLHTEDAAATVAEIKARYEARLMRMFGEDES
ncbi:Na+/H+ antiporter subunit E [Tepidiphilus thermophilus]|jgi:multicomponent K+:H+ antiporter subunit E|uniref:Multisubunit Na+/H+ antiporter, MnhE subunit n=1 Tax=Tepidiphilus thermophilus TaxID=876478 RepID=A0A0K6ITU8_9PROT|nr:Na+/H+ antiporter subunit E [Tepidiphilus thermophilus]MDK2798022.1 multicomponent antiporter subunit [Tepidiphilus sp.]CUB06747.1 Multisubunit Na+/H+ antiporter, MnhE subunit [Tepidiphilus thermophilus]